MSFRTKMKSLWPEFGKIGNAPFLFAVDRFGTEAYTPLHGNGQWKFPVCPRDVHLEELLPSN